MSNESSLIATLALSLVAALLGALVAARLRLPQLVGYLLGGVLIGPFASRLVPSTHLAQEIAEVGVIQLMFGVGLHFSIRELLKMPILAFAGAVLQMLVATCLATALAYSWGWSLGGALVFGLALSVASTVVLLRALQTDGTLESEAGRIAVGWLLAEDLVTVLVLVMLPAFAGILGQAPGPDVTAKSAHLGDILAVVGITSAKLATFIAAMLLAGKRILRWVLKRVEQVGSDELLVTALGAIALGVAYCAVKVFDASFALGAFAAGLVLNESDLGQPAAKHLHTLENALVVLFFVAVGMLFDPRILVQEPLRVLAVLAVILINPLVFRLARTLKRGTCLPTAEAHGKCTNAVSS